MGMDMVVGGTDVPKRRHFAACEPFDLIQRCFCLKVVIFGRFMPFLVGEGGNALTREGRSGSGGGRRDVIVSGEETDTYLQQHFQTQ
jgi:hypothetical protein